MKQVLLIVALLVSALAACSRRDELRPATAVTPSSSENIEAAFALVRVPVYRGAEIEKQAAVTRFVDGDAGVLCYQGTLSPVLACVPMSHTLLRPDGTSRYPEAVSSKK